MHIIVSQYPPDNPQQVSAWKLHDDSSYRDVLVVAGSLSEALRLYQEDALAVWRRSRQFGQDDPPEGILQPQISKAEQIEIESIIFRAQDLGMPEVRPAKIPRTPLKRAKPPKKKKKMSAEARQKISEGMKRSYARRTAPEPGRPGEPFRDDWGEKG